MAQLPKDVNDWPEPWRSLFWDRFEQAESRAEPGVDVGLVRLEVEIQLRHEFRAAARREGRAGA